MNTVYLFFDDENIRIPFYNYDKALFNQLMKSGMGFWDKSENQYFISRSQYDLERLRKIFGGKPFVEVCKEANNPLIVHDFLSLEKDDETEIENFTEENAEPVNTKCDLPNSFFKHWKEIMNVEMHARSYSPHTKRAYVNYNIALCKWLNKTPEAVTSYDIKRYLAYLNQTKNQATATINYNLSAFKFLYSQILKRDTVREQKRPRQDKRLPVVLSKSEVKKIIDSEANNKHRLLLMMVYASGLRVSEAVNLRQQDIDFERKTITVVDGKGRKDRYTIMSDTVYEMLKEYFRQYEITNWIFPGYDKNHHIRIRTAQKIFKHALSKANIKKDAAIHSLRHTFATHLLERGTDITYIGKLLGHNCIRTTARYTHVAKMKTLKIISPLDTIDREDD